MCVGGGGGGGGGETKLYRHVFVMNFRSFMCSVFPRTTFIDSIRLY